MDRYISKQIVFATVFGVALFSILLVLGNLFKEIRPLLVEEQASPMLIGQFMLSVLPYSLIYTVPWGFLIAVLLVFGRLSSCNELISMRMAGVGLFRISLPVFVIGAILSLFCLWLNTTMAPRASDTIKRVLYEAVKENPNALLDPGVVQTRFKGQKIFVEGRKNDTLYGLHIYQLKNEEDTGFPTGCLYARKAKLKVIQETQQLRLHLTDVLMEMEKPDGGLEYPFIGEQEPLLFDFAKEHKKKKKTGSMTNHEIHEYLDNNPQLHPTVKIRLNHEIQRRYAFSLACLALCLVGVPLGINARRKETSSGMVISILVALGYFLFFVIAKHYEKSSGNTALILYWTPNILCLLLGIFLFHKARRK